MANINIVCIGKLKEKYWQAAQDEYTKRLTAFTRLRIIEKKEALLPGKASDALVAKACAQESDALLNASSGYMVALSPDGEKMSSEAFASFLQQHIQTGNVTFAIGGSHGLSQNFKSRAGKLLSFSDMTMPHQLFRIVLLEQIYRAFMISSGRTYHK